jgi:hypothetical protein
MSLSDAIFSRQFNPVEAHAIIACTRIAELEQRGWQGICIKGNPFLPATCSKSVLFPFRDREDLTLSTRRQSRSEGTLEHFH